MRTGLMYGYRVGIHDVEKDPKTYQEERRKLEKKIKRTIEVIRAHKCLSTKGEFYGDVYKKARRHLSDKRIIEEYNKIKKDLSLVVIRKLFLKGGKDESMGCREL